MRYLCIETSNSSGFLSLFSDQKKEKEISWESEKHSEKIVQSLEPFLNQSIDFIAVDRGPGRFTGIRTAVNCAKTLAYVLSCPVFSCTSLRIQAEDSLEKTQKPVICLMEAFGEKFYVAAYQRINQKVKTLLEPVSFSKQQVEEWIQQAVVCVGDVYEKKKSLFSKKTQSLIESKKYQNINSKDFSSVVCREWKKENLQNWSTLEPLYLRVPGVLKKNG